MLTAQQFLLYLPAVALIIATPGPDMLMSLSRGLSQGRTAAAAYAAGVAVGIMVHSAFAALGVSVLLKTTELAFWMFKLAGGVYLLYLGVQLWRAQRRDWAQSLDCAPLSHVFLRGMLTNVLNPKVALFVLALIPQFADAHSGSSVAVQILLLGAIFSGLTLLAYATLGAAAHRTQAWMQARPRLLAAFNRFTAGVFVLAGLGILSLERR